MKSRVVLHKEQGSSGMSSMSLVHLKINTVRLRLMRADHDPWWLKVAVQKAHQPDGRQETYSPITLRSNHCDMPCCKCSDNMAAWPPLPCSR